MRSVAPCVVVLVVVLVSPMGLPAAMHLPEHVVSQSLAVPPGTKVNVRLTQDIDVDLAQAGMTYKTRVDDPVAIDGVIAIPREALAIIQAVKVAQSTEFKGSDKISLKLNTVSFGGRSYQVASETRRSRGRARGSERRARWEAARGSVRSSAELPAVVRARWSVPWLGGIAGTAVAASGEEHLRLPAETRLQFTLTMKVLIEPDRRLFFLARHASTTSPQRLRVIDVERRRRLFASQYRRRHGMHR